MALSSSASTSLLAVLLLSGCTVASPGGTPPSGDPANDAPATAYTVQGLVRDTRGQPLAGAEIEVASTQYGTSYKTRTGEDGRYAVHVEEGAWRVLGSATVPYHGNKYCLALAPDVADAFWGADGAVRDMRLAIQGPGLNPDSSPRGGRIDFDLRLTGLDASATYAFALELEPVDALMDGSKGETIVRSATFPGSEGTSDLVLQDIPLGAYRVRVSLSGPEGSGALQARVTNPESRAYGTDVVLFDGGFLTCGEELRSNVDVTF